MKRIFLAGAFFLSVINTYACDICGCSAGDYFIGVFPEFRKHFIGARYTFRSFKSVMADDPSQYSRDFYQTVEIWGGLNIGKKWQALVFLPYNINRQQSDDGVSHSSGIGDISVILQYHLLDKTSPGAGGKTVSQQLWIGGGLKIPSGKFSPDPNDIIPEAANQAGTGSVDYLANAMYAIRFGNWGISTTANYKINSKADGYRFGDRFSASAFVYRSFRSGTTVISPNAGLLVQHLAANKLDGEKVPDSGGRAVMVAGGLETTFDKVSVGLNAQLPLAQNFSNDQTKARVRGMLHLTYSF